MIPTLRVQIPQLIPKLSLVDSIVIHFIAKLDITFPRPNSPLQGAKGRRSNEEFAQDIPPLTSSALPQPVFKHKSVEVFQLPLSDLKILSSDRKRKPNKD